MSFKLIHRSNQITLKRLFIYLAFFLGTISVCFAGNIAQQWAQIKTTTFLSNHAESIGTYNAGCLSGAVALAANGDGYQVMRLSRKRYYGHPELIRFIENLGHQAHRHKLGTLLIGDLGQPRGGPTLTGHRSHQTGLDVDIWFLLSQVASSRKLALNERESWGAPSVLAGQSDGLNFSEWSPNNEKILELAATLPEVDRIFVNPSVKRQLCSHKNSQNWLRKIRPWWKHDDHFHVRLRCPPGNAYCQNQDPLPQGDGCDTSLAWWFSEEAKSPKARKPQIEKELVLPGLCSQVLNN
jgi:penicillin-insensitive murein DD-endopeptidase